MVRPVFFDPSGSRRRWTRRALFALLALLIVACTVFASTVLEVPAPSPLPIGYERMNPLPFRTQISRIEHRIDRFLHRGAAPAPAPGHALTLAFYTPWNDDSAPALRRNINQIDWLAPAFYSLDAQGHLLARDDMAMRRVISGSLHRPLVMPVLQNTINGHWDGVGAARLMHDPRQRRQLVEAIQHQLAVTNDAGVMFDLENLPATALPDLVRLVGETRAALGKDGKLVSVTMPIDDAAWPAKALARVADKLVLMAYDEHWQGGQAGPIASDSWFIGHLSSTLSGIPADRVIVALGNYAYDWHEGRADALTVEEAWVAARDSETVPQFDPAAGNAGFSYSDGPVRHDVWMLDAAASWNQLLVLRRMGIGNVALWRLGSEDPGFWTDLASWRARMPGPTWP